MKKALSIRLLKKFGSAAIQNSNLKGRMLGRGVNKNNNEYIIRKLKEQISKKDKIIRKYEKLEDKIDSRVAQSLELDKEIKRINTEKIAAIEERFKSKISWIFGLLVLVSILPIYDRIISAKTLKNINDQKVLLERQRGEVARLSAETAKLNFNSNYKELKEIMKKYPDEKEIIKTREELLINSGLIYIDNLLSSDNSEDYKEVSAIPIIMAMAEIAYLMEEEEIKGIEHRNVYFKEIQYVNKILDKHEGEYLYYPYLKDLFIN